MIITYYARYIFILLIFSIHSLLYTIHYSDVFKYKRTMYFTAATMMSLTILFVLHRMNNNHVSDNVSNNNKKDEPDQSTLPIENSNEQAAETGNQQDTDTNNQNDIIHFVIRECKDDTNTVRSIHKDVIQYPLLTEDFTNDNDSPAHSSNKHEKSEAEQRSLLIKNNKEIDRIVPIQKIVSPQERVWATKELTNLFAYYYLPQYCTRKKHFFISLQGLPEQSRFLSQITRRHSYYSPLNTETTNFTLWREGYHYTFIHDFNNSKNATLTFDSHVPKNEWLYTANGFDTARFFDGPNSNGTHIFLESILHYNEMFGHFIYLLKKKNSLVSSFQEVPLNEQYEVIYCHKDQGEVTDIVVHPHAPLFLYTVKRLSSEEKNDAIQHTLVWGTINEQSNTINTERYALYFKPKQIVPLNDCDTYLLLSTKGILHVVWQIDQNAIDCKGQKHNNLFFTHIASDTSKKNEKGFYPIALLEKNGALYIADLCYDKKPLLTKVMHLASPGKMYRFYYHKQTLGLFYKGGRTEGTLEYWKVRPEILYAYKNLLHIPLPVDIDTPKEFIESTNGECWGNQ